MARARVWIPALVLLAEFDDVTLAGRWEKLPTMGNVSHTNTLRDQVLIYVK